MSRVNVTKTFLPPIEEYQAHIEQIWKSGQLTNQGPLLKQLENELEEFLGVKNLHFVTNGTIALQIALKALGITEGEIITTPFSYVATTSAILWERCKPVYVDIEPDSLNIDTAKIEQAITPNTKAILAVHVFGNPCDVETIEALAKKHNLKVLYDAAHAFGVGYKGKSVFEYGDISTCSFHATKLFHTIEGGCVIASEQVISEKLGLIKRFGHYGDDHKMVGINAKASEFQAAMGLCNLNHIDEIIQDRKKASNSYTKKLRTDLSRQSISHDAEYNYSYYPVVFKSEKELLDTVTLLNANNIFPRRYFYPSLNELPYINTTQNCAVSQDISTRILCLPLYFGIEEDVINKVCEIINGK